MTSLQSVHYLLIARVAEYCGHQLSQAIISYDDRLYKLVGSSNIIYWLVGHYVIVHMYLSHKE